MTSRPTYVLVSGPPASGKSTVAPPSAAVLRLPLLAKDEIKDALVSVLDVPDVRASRRVGSAAVAAMLAVAARCPGGAVLESVWYRSRAPAVAALPGAVVEVFCRCDRAVLEERYWSRAASGRAGAFDADRPAEERWNDEVGSPLGGGWPVVEVDTTAAVDVDAVAAAVQGALGPS